MANRFFRNTGSTDWAVTTNWSLTDGGGSVGAVPTNADDVFFSNQSGNCVINSGAKVAKSIDFTAGTGFTGTFTHNGATLGVSGNVTLSATQGVISGSGSLVTNANGTLKSNGVTWPLAFTFNTNSGVHTLLGNWVNTGPVNNVLSCTVTPTTTETFTCNGGLSSPTTTITTTAKFILGGGTWVSTGTGGLFGPADLAGNVVFGSTINYRSGAGALTYVSGTIDTSGNTLFAVQATSTFNTGANVVFPNFRATGVMTLNSDLYVTTFETYGTGSSFAGSGHLTSSGTAGTVTNFNVHLTTAALTFTLPEVYTVTGAFTFSTDTNSNNIGATLNGNSFILKGNVTITGYTNGIGGTATFLHSGTGTFSSSPYSASGIFQIPSRITSNFTINTAGTITFGADYAIGGGVFTWTAGTPITTNSELWVVSATTINASAVNWNIMHFIPQSTAGMTITLTSALNFTDINFWFFTTTFSGTFDYTGANLFFWAGITNQAGAVLVSGRTMTISTNIESYGNANFHPKISATTPSSPAFLTFNGTTQKVIYLDATDIDSHLGKTIWYLGGTMLRTVNWSQSLSSIPPVAVGNIFI